MKKLSTIIIAMALVLGMTQCKKKLTTVTPASQGGVYLKVNVNSNYKAIVDPSGTVDFEDGDFLFVANGGAMVGALIYDSGQFSGEIGPDNILQMPATLDYSSNLSFVYTGGVIPNISDFTVDIWDQRDGLPVLSCGDTGGTTLEDVINDGGVIPSLELKNQCALVQFQLNQATTEDVRIFNVLTQVSLSIGASDNKIHIEPTGERGYMILNRKGTDNNDKRWGILLTGQEAMPTADVTVGYAKYTGVANIPSIILNGLQNATINNSGDGVIAKDVFSIDDGKWVKFSHGNVQYNDDTKTWRFADNQWDYIGGTDANNQHYDNISESSNNSIGESGYEGWIDLFGWGTAEEPTKYIIDTYDNPAPGTGQYSCVYDVFNEWGKKVGDGKWYTMKKTEWEYLIDYGKTTAERTAKIAPATVNDVEGVVILPDAFVQPSGCLYVAPEYNPTSEDRYYHHMEEYDMNEYDATQWEAMEAAGAVFLPAAGYRMGQEYIRNCPADGTDPASFYLRYYGPGSKGAKTSYGLYGKARMWVEDCLRCEGLSVRLVRKYDF